ncbi:MAG: hypothetical protein NTZ98_13140 [Acidobacteria bacterium]|nr:hypothetical protein [Acidobacteriota bacterium]
MVLLRKKTDAEGEQAPIPIRPRHYQLEVQELTIGACRYTVMVGVADGAWHCCVQQGDTTVFGPRECASQAEAKFLGHAMAFGDAGLNDHYCNGNCAAWLKAD